MTIFKKKAPKVHRTRLGILLVKFGADQNAIDAAMLDYYSRGRCGEYCLSVGACTQEQLNKALAVQAAEREDYAEAIKFISSTIDVTHNKTMELLTKFRDQLDEMVVKL